MNYGKRMLFEAMALGMFNNMIVKAEKRASENIFKNAHFEHKRENYLNKKQRRKLGIK